MNHLNVLHATVGGQVGAQPFPQPRGRNLRRGLDLIVLDHLANNVLEYLCCHVLGGVILLFRALFLLLLVLFLLFILTESYILESILPLVT